MTTTARAALRRELAEATTPITGNYVDICDDYYGSVVLHHPDVGGAWHPEHEAAGWRLWEYTRDGGTRTTSTRTTLEDAYLEALNLCGRQGFTLANNDRWEVTVNGEPLPAGEDGNPHPDQELSALATLRETSHYVRIPNYAQLERGLLTEEQKTLFEKFTWPDIPADALDIYKEQLLPLYVYASTPDGVEEIYTNYGYSCVLVRPDGTIKPDDYDLALQFVRNRWSENIEVDYLASPMEFNNGGFNITREWALRLTVRPNGTVHVTGHGPTFSRRRHPNGVDVTCEFKELETRGFDPATLVDVPGGLITTTDEGIQAA